MLKLLLRHAFIKVGSQHRLRPDQRLITVALMLNEKGCDMQKVDGMGDSIIIFKVQKFFVDCLTGTSCWQRGTALHAVFWHLFTSSHFMTLLQLYSILIVNCPEFSARRGMFFLHDVYEMEEKISDFFFHFIHIM